MILNLKIILKNINTLIISVGSKTWKEKMLSYKFSDA